MGIKHTAKRPKRRNAGKHRTAPVKEIPEGTPISLIVRKGEVGRSVRQLIQDLRQTMMPLTVNKVKENRTNVLEDFVSIARPLGVTHLFVISQRHKNIYMRLGKTPHGPTLTFQVLKYSLMADVRGSQASEARTTPTDYRTSPLLALNGFSSRVKPTADSDVDPRSVELMRQVFVSMFPSIDVREVRVDNATKRVVLFLHSAPGIVEMRQYAIMREISGASQSIAALYSQSRAASKGVMPKEQVLELSQLISQVKEVKDEPASEDEDVKVKADESCPRNVINIKSHLLMQPTRDAAVEQKRTLNAADVDMKLSLVELGPRLSMKLVRVQADVCRGEVLFEDPLIGNALTQLMPDVDDVEAVPFKGDSKSEEEEEEEKETNQAEKETEIDDSMLEDVLG